MKKLTKAKALILSLLIFALALSVFSGGLFAADGGEYISIYINDDIWFDDNTYPLIERDDALYVPLSVFSVIDGIKTTRSDRLGSVLLERGEKYISYSMTDSTYILPDGKIQSVPLYSYNGELYLPAEDTVNALGLSSESAYGKTGFLSYRICDGSEMLSFFELNEAYDRSDRLYDTTVQITPGTKLELGYTPFYICMYSPAINELDRIIDTLKAYGMTATFLFVPSEIEKYESFLPELCTLGHTIGYYYEGTTAAGFVADATRANDYLYSKLFMRAHIVTAQNIPDADAAYLLDNGFVRKRDMLTMTDETLLSNVFIRYALEESAKNNISVFLMQGNSTARAQLTVFLNAILGIPGYKAGAMNECSPRNIASR